jgi:hypothetical protein
MNEWILIAMLTLATFLFAAGGTGYKWLRRYVMPFLLGICLLLLKVTWWQTLIASGVLCAVMHLGYGEDFEWWAKPLVGLAYALPSLVIGISLWISIVPIIFFVLFILSNCPATKDSFTWVICEAIFGFIITASLISAVLNPWIV